MGMGRMRTDHGRQYLKEFYIEKQRVQCLFRLQWSGRAFGGRKSPANKYSAFGTLRTELRFPESGLTAVRRRMHLSH
jgi:hypothetical protein